MESLDNSKLAKPAWQTSADRKEINLKFSQIEHFFNVDAYRQQLVVEDNKNISLQFRTTTIKFNYNNIITCVYKYKNNDNIVYSV